MIKLYFLLIFNIIIFYINLFATNIVTVNTDYILKESKQYSLFIKKLSTIQKNLENELKDKENILLNKQKEIENSKLILNDIEITKMIDIYNNEVNIFQTEVNKINTYIADNLDKNRNLILQKIIFIIEDISTRNNYDIVLNQNNYFISSENVNISKLVINSINNQIIDFNIYPFR